MYMEPPEWHFSVREALGGALLLQGKAAEAESVFREDLRLHPRNPRSLFGLLEALKAQNKDASVDWVKKEYAEGWQYASRPIAIAEL
jgi:hypothetical protein